MNSRHSRNRKQAGFTLVELGIVLALIGIGLFFAISKINETNDSSKAANTSTDLSSIITNFKRLYATQNNYPAAGYNIGDLRANGVFPESWFNPAVAAAAAPGSNIAVITPFGSGNPTAGQSPLLPVGDFAFITLPGVPSRVCAELGRLMANGVTRIDVDAQPNVKPQNGALNVPLLGTACATAANVAMTFHFGRS